MVLQKVDPRDESGQVLALGALSMLVLALMLMMSFNLSEAIHNKIQLQQSTDAEAYSMAVVEARTFNYIAYSNRAIAADLVAMATLHGYMSMMSAEVSAFHAGFVNMIEIGIEELGLCFACWPPCFIHCYHAFQAFERAAKYDEAYRKYGNKLKKVEKPFNDSIETLELSIQHIHGSELAMLGYLAVDILRGKKLDELNNYNAPQAGKLPMMVGGLNIHELGCAVDGTVFGMACVTGAKASSAKEKAELITEIANASRPKFTSHRSLFGTLYPNFYTWLDDLMLKIPKPGASFPVSYGGTSKLVQKAGADPNSPETPLVGNDVGAKDSGYLISWLHDGVGFWGFSGDIYSDHSGGKHDPKEAHSQTHNKFKGVGKVDGSPGCLGGDCFVKFRSDPKAADAFGQPAVYAYASRDLSVNRSGAHGPWELNKQGKVEIKFGNQTGDLTLRASTGAAMSKALVYYHRLGDWQDPPNFFNPYWRAKLQPFTHTEELEVLAAARNFKAISALATAPTAPAN